MANKKKGAPKHHYGKILSIEPVPSKKTKATFAIEFRCSRTKCEDSMLIFKKTHNYVVDQFVRIITDKNGYLKPSGIPTAKELKEFNIDLEKVVDTYDHLF
tara:strand:+ start:329 stop:631 length:303 start_codon:yes stop_codon:yes gene_type:complete